MANVERALHSELEKVSRLGGEWFPADLLDSVDRFFNSRGKELPRARS
jgi:hypothetical protein